MREGVLLCPGKAETASPKFMHRHLTIGTPTDWSPGKVMLKIFCSNLSQRWRFNHILMSHQGPPDVFIGEFVDKLIATW
jgi:hypothetical protein